MIKTNIKEGGSAKHNTTEKRIRMKTMISSIIIICFVFVVGVLRAVDAQQGDQSFQSCLDNCSPVLPGGTFRTDCCGCCSNLTSPYTCHQIAEFETCCNSSQAFCGCLNSRASCFNIPTQGQPNITSHFGSCYNPTAFSCNFNQNFNSWILCPGTSSACFSTSGNTAICCDEDATCHVNSTTGNPFCMSSPNNPPPNQTQVHCGRLTCLPGELCCNDIEYGALCYSNTTDQCINNQHLCSVNDSFCANTGCFDPSVYVCCQDSGLIQQKIYGCPPANPCQPPSGVSCGPAICGADNLCCMDVTLGPVCYNSSNFVCVGNEVLCGCAPNGNCNMGACGTICYDANLYICCEGNQVSQRAIGCLM